MKKISMRIATYLLSSVLLFGCSNQNGGGDMINYSEIYDRFPSEKIYVIQPDHTKAHYGYTANDKQGHQSWYYGQYLNGNFIEMPYDSITKSFKNDSAEINKETQLGIGSARLWQSTFTGEVFISGKFIANEQTNLSIIKNNTEVAFYQVNSGETRYIEQNITILKDDRLFFVVNGNAEFNPTIYYGKPNDENIHYDAGKDTALPFVGDVHPLYVDGQLRNYYLSTNGQFTADMAISDDLVVFNDTNTIASPTNPPMTEGFATRVFKHKDMFYSFYGAYNRFEYTKSKDGYVFENGVEFDEKFNIKGQFNVDDRYIWGRDPYAFFDPDINKYRVISLNYIENRTDQTLPNIDLALYTSINDEPHMFSSDALPLINFGVTNNEPEVPMMLKIKNRWYLFASMSGRTHNFVGPISYWIGDENKRIDEVNWNTKEEHILTGEDLCASQIVEIDGRLYLYGWIAQDSNNSRWGGTINIPQEVYQLSDGTLGVKIDHYLQEKISKGTISNLKNDTYFTTDLYDIESKILKKGNISNTFSILKFTENYKRTITHASFSNIENNGVIGLEITNWSGVYQIRYSSTNKNIQINKKGVGVTYSKLETPRFAQETINFVVIAEGNILEVFVNDEYAISARIDEELRDYEIGVYTTQNEIKLDCFIVNKLATKHNFQDN